MTNHSNCTSTMPGQPLPLLTVEQSGGGHLIHAKAKSLQINVSSGHMTEAARMVVGQSWIPANTSSGSGLQIHERGLDVSVKPVAIACGLWGPEWEFASTLIWQ